MTTKKANRQLLKLTLLLLLQLFVLTKLVKYDKMNNIDIQKDVIDVSQSSLVETTYISSTTEDSDFVLGDLNSDGIVSDDDFKLLQEYAKYSDSLPESLFKVADINNDDEFDTRDVSAFRRKFELGE